MATDIEEGASPQRDVRGDAVHPLLDRLVAYSWRFLVVGAATVALLWLLGQLRIVLIPLVVALLLSRVLSVPTSWLTRRRWRGGLAAGAALVGFLALLAGGVAVISSAVADEVDDLGPTLSTAVDDVERWLVEDTDLAHEAAVLYFDGADLVAVDNVALRGTNGDFRIDRRLVQRESGIRTEAR